MRITQLATMSILYIYVSTSPRKRGNRYFLYHSRSIVAEVEVYAAAVDGKVPTATLVTKKNTNSSVETDREK